MDNQHRKISGYRELTRDDIELMNRIKSVEQSVLEIVKNVNTHLSNQTEYAQLVGDAQEQFRIAEAEPLRWSNIGRTHFQEGFMALVRAIAQPGPANPPTID